MNEFTRILRTIRRPFQQETRNGCLDNVVINGLGNYVKLWLEKARQLSLDDSDQQTVDKLASHFANYDRLPAADRLKIIESATAEIDAIASERSPDPPQTHASRGRRPQSREPAEATHPSPPASHTPTTSGKEPSVPPPEPHAPPIHNPLPNEDVVIGDTPVETDVRTLDFLATPLHDTKGIGTRRANKLTAELDTRTLGDLLQHYPHDYIDRRSLREIYDVGRSGEQETIQGKVVNHDKFTPRRKGAKSVGKVMIFDGTGVAVLVNFGRRIGYLRSVLKVGTSVVISGKFGRRNNEIQTTDYEFEILEDEDANLIHTGRIVAKYPLTANLTQRMLRQWINNVLDEYGDMFPEILPLNIRQRLRLIDWRTATREIHHPASDSYSKAARKRLAFDEFFLLGLGLELKKKRREIAEKGISFKVESQLLDRFIDTLPFRLTEAQNRVFKAIRADMEDTHPMNRLLQGDVGSGKTIVAAMTLLCAIQSGYQGALMVPTEILAEQHAYNFSELLKPIGLNVVLLKGDLTKSEREAVLAVIADGSAQIVVGTHALIQEGVDFHRLGLVIIDEQHRFGVMQRATLRDKGVTPDVLVMTATPIPRTLALTVYGDLNVSVIDEMPPGRQTVGTKWVKEGQRAELYRGIEKSVQRGRQAYIVYPLVEESEKLEEIKAATEMAERLQCEVFPHLHLGLLHGRMRSLEKQEVMAQFKAKQIDILVSTTVIEVGIDVPNATIMVIENAERFGLAQLHQLRGRVGRGKHKSFCYLVPAVKSQDSVERMRVMTRTNDGFEIAEADLKLRGPGEFFGTRQSGLPNLRLANLIQDAPLLEAAKTEANRLAQADPGLRQPEHQLLKRLLRTHWKENLELATVG
ncbi:MAG: ATP-dependent DNA helicase RecG [Candidatus Poribacteria bacterium]|nr:ATP-dependent DNA helicase RecG [Candidatus Poribacteria bacterium]